jgi:DNA-binding MarR family transcriptional regulator
MSYANDMPAARSVTSNREHDVDADLARALRLSSMRLARRLRVERGSDDFTLSQLAVLGSLDRQGEATVGELANLERVKPPSMTRIVNSLVEAGMVTRRPHATDGRQVVVELTDDARAVLAEDRRRRNAWLAQRLAELTDDERALLAQAAPLLDRLAAS